MTSRRKQALAKRRAQAMAIPTDPTERPFRASLKSKVQPHEMMGLEDHAGGMCRMLLGEFHRLDRPAKDKPDCDDIAARAGATKHLFVPN